MAWTSSSGIPVQAYRTHMVAEVLAVRRRRCRRRPGWGGVPREGLQARPRTSPPCGYCCCVPFFVSYARSYFTSRGTEHRWLPTGNLFRLHNSPVPFLVLQSQSWLEDSLRNLSSVFFLRPPLESINVPSPSVHLIQRDSAVQANGQLHQVGGGLRKEF